MGQTEYIVRFKGDYSALAKDLKQIGAATKQIADDEVIIKLHYDGNIKEFNKTFDTISKMHPELGIQFQYNVNEKLLNQELEKLKGITELQLDIDENKVRDKLQNLGNSVETAFNEGLSKDEITKRVKQFFGYYNTATKAGVKDISKLFYGIRTRIYDALKSDNHISIFDDLIDADEKKSFELFKIDKSLKDDLVDTQNRVNDIKDTLKSLEEKGASKTGLPSELQKVQDEIKILRSDIEEMKGDLKNLSGDAFDAMTQQIKDTNEQLRNALELVKELKTTLSDNGITKNNSVGNVIKQWQKEKETQTNERYTAFNSQSKQTSGAHLAADAEGVSMKLIRSAIDEMGDEADGTIHSHPMKFAAFSDDDIERYFNLFEDTQGKIFSHAVTSAEQAISIDMSKIDTSKKKDILSFIKEEYSNIDNQLIGNIGSKSKELKNTVNTILEKYQNNNESNPQIKELVNNIQQGVDVMFANLGDVFSYEDFADSFDSLLGNSAKQTAKDLGAKTIDDLKSMLQRFMPNIGEIMESVEDAVLIPLNNQAQQAYQNVLQKVFTNPKFLKSGETSAIKIEALSDFIDWGSIEQSAKEASQKAADALQEAQDSNSPAELTKPLGKDFGLGYAEGIREAMPEIVEACREVVLAAYNTIKEAKTSEDGESVDFSKGLINSFKESLDKATPTIQGKIKELFSAFDMGDGENPLSDFGWKFADKLVRSIQDGLDGEYNIRSLGKTLEILLNSAFEKAVLDTAVQSIVDNIQKSLDDMTSFSPIQIKYFEPQTDSLIFEIESALENHKFNVDLGGTIKDLSTALNASTENVRTSFIDAVRWMREADKWQKENGRVKPRERKLYYNTKTGEFSNPSIIGGDHSTPVYLDMASEYKKKGVVFDTDLHTHLYDNYAFPSSVGNAAGGGQGDIDNFFSRAYNSILNEVYETISKFVVGAQQEYVEFDFSKIASNAEELENFLTNWIENNFDEVKKVLGKTAWDYKDDPRRIAGLYVGRKLVNLAKEKKTYSGYTPSDDVDELLTSMFKSYNVNGTIESQITGEKQSIKDIFDEELPITSDVRDLFDTMPDLLKQMLDAVVRKIKLWITETAGLGGNIDGGVVNDAIDDALSTTLVDDKFSELKDFRNQFKEVLKSYFIGEFTQGRYSVTSDKTWDQFGSEALHKLIDSDDLIGRIVKYYTPDEFEKKFGKGIVSQVSNSQQNGINPALPPDFQQQLQNAIDATGEYIVKVYGELVEDFKSRLQNAIDESGLYHVDIEGWLYDTFHNRLQGDIDDQEKYYIEVKGRLIETFKDTLQELIDNLGAFPIQVKPYMRKGEEIEEVELPGGGSSITQVGENLNSEAKDANEEFNDIYDTLLKIVDLENKLNNTPKNIEKLRGNGEFLPFAERYLGDRDGLTSRDEIKSNIKSAYGIYTKAQSKLKAGEVDQSYVDNAYSTLIDVMVSNFNRSSIGISKEYMKGILSGVGKERGVLPKKMEEFVDEFIEEYLSFPKRNNQYHKELKDLYGEDPDETLKLLKAKISSKGVGLNKEIIPDDLFEDEEVDDAKRINDILSNAKLTSDNFADTLKQICDILGIEIPQNAEIAGDKINEALNENNGLNHQGENDNQSSATTSLTPSIQDEQEVVQGVVDSESNILQSLIDALQHVIDKVDEKTRAFQEEGQVVEGVVQNELTNLDVLSGYLINLRDEVSKVSAEFQGMDVKINIKDTGVDKVTKFVSALSKINDDKIEEKIIRVFSSLDDFAIAVNNIKINDNGILSSINNLLSKSKELENLASVLKESKKKIKEATKATKEKNEPKNYASKYNRKLDSLGSKLGDDIGNYRGKGVYAEKYLSQLKEIQGEVSKLKKLDVADEKDIQELEKIEDKIKKIKSEEGAYSGAEKQVNGLIDKVNKLRDSGKYTQTFVSELDAAEGELRSFLRQLKDGGVAFDEIDDKVTVLAKNVEDTLAKKAFADFKQAAEKSLTNLGLKIDQIVAKNSGMGSYFESEFKKLREMSDTAESVGDVQRLVAAINKLESEMINAGKTGKSFIDQIKQRLRDINSKYIAQYFSFQDILRYARQAVTNVIQLNDAFIELSKVSNTALKTLEADFQSYADIAKKIGGTITDTINATADWARLGYNVPDAKQLAEVALLYKNVGDGIDIDAANTSLISTLQGFQLEADDALSIIDKFNEVSNNFAISSGGIGEGLQRSAAAFNAANTNLSQSIALITATNEIVQDPDAVGNMWTTVSARIRGAKTELEDMGEDTEDMVESTSKLRDLVKGITGVDIMIDENTFKDIYTIVTQIGEKWNDINDIDQANHCLYV